MKILVISGSSRDKRTNYMLKTIADSSGLDYDFIKLADKDINYCVNCKGCHKNFKCGRNDSMTDIYKKLDEADVVLLGSPTYFDNVSGIMKNFMDRCLPFYFSGRLKNKKVIIVTSSGFSELVEIYENGKCVLCETWECEESANACLNAMQDFCDILEMKIIDKIYSIHGDPESKKEELIKIGERIASFKK